MYSPCLFKLMKIKWLILGNDGLHVSILAFGKVSSAA